MSTLPLSHFDLDAAPPPMAPLTHVVISPQNIAMEARLSRAKPLSRRQVRKLDREARRLEKRIRRESRGMETHIQRFQELRGTLRGLWQQRNGLAAQRQADRQDETLKAQWQQLYQTALPLQREYESLRQQLSHLYTLYREAAAIRQRIDDNPLVIANAKAEEERIRLQKAEARAYEQLILERFTQLGYCHHWNDSKGEKRVDRVQFSEAHITMDAVFFKIAASYRNMFGGWKTRIPYGVKIGDLVKEETLLELAYACQRQVTAKANLTGGAWIIVHRLDTNDGLMNQVRYNKVMERYPFKHHDKIPLCVGVAHHRQVQWLTIAHYPHVLVAGFTGSGKSNFINSIICTLIAQHSPDEVRLLLVDLKDGVEFSSYEHIPHLHGEVVDKISTLADRLQELEAIMQERNQKMRGKAKTIAEYNAKYTSDHMPRIICIIDEVASIMAHGELTKRINNSLRQLTAKGRAPGIHIILSTQRPSVDAIDGGIKVNLAARIVGRMPSHSDSLTVLGTGEAKELAAVPGRMILQIGPDPMPVQTPMIEEADIVEALRRAMEYPTPDPLPVPEGYSLAEEWTPEKIVELSLKYLGGNISHSAVWEEIKDEGGLSRSQLREMMEHIWKMDCIPYDDKQYRVARGGGKVRKLVEIPQLTDSPISPPYAGGELVGQSDG